eukprot:SAG11_NODE_22158_length_411_cov_0.673077_1_plen_121_part_01
MIKRALKAAVGTGRALVEFERIFGEDPTASRAKLGAPLEGGDFRVGANTDAGGLLRHPLWPRLEPVLQAPWHRPAVLQFAERCFGPFVQLDAFGVTGYPASPDADISKLRGSLAPQVRAFF